MHLTLTRGSRASVFVVELTQDHKLTQPRGVSVPIDDIFKYWNGKDRLQVPGLYAFKVFISEKDAEKEWDSHSLLWDCDEIRSRGPHSQSRRGVERANSEAAAASFSARGKESISFVKRYPKSKRQFFFRHTENKFTKHKR